MRQLSRNTGNSPMNTRARLAVAALAVGSLGFGAVAQADPFVGRLIGSVAAGMLVNGAIKSHDKKFAAQCRLYDREGMEVYLPCDSRRPLGEVLLAARPDAMADGLAGGPPVEAPPPADYAAANDMPAYAPPPPRYAPMPEPDCGCGPRPAAPYRSAQGGHAQTSYGAGRVVGVYDAYEDFSSSSAVRYSESYSGGYVGGGYDYGYVGGGASSSFYPYGGVGYGAGGYADGARVAGRDAQGFLTWPGKRVR
jgi:hypothetical protein